MYIRPTMQLGKKKKKTALASHTRERKNKGFWEIKNITAHKNNTYKNRYIF